MPLVKLTPMAWKTDRRDLTKRAKVDLHQCGVKATVSDPMQILIYQGFDHRPSEASSFLWVAWSLVVLMNPGHDS